MPVLAVISTVGSDRLVGVLNASKDGVLLTSPDVPGEGQMVMFRSTALQSLGRVVWSAPGRFGVAFEEPLAQSEVEELRREANITADLPYLTFPKRARELS